MEGWILLVVWYGQEETFEILWDCLSSRIVLVAFSYATSVSFCKNLTTGLDNKPVLQLPNRSSNM